MRILDWRRAGETERRDALRRPALRDAAAVDTAARAIVDAVRRNGDEALREFTRRFDGARLDALRASAAEFAAAERELGADAIAAIDTAIENVRGFHAAQAAPPIVVETAGVRCERRTVPIGAVGLYVPAGSAPLPSTAIMLAVPAAIAGCPVRVICTPPRPDGLVPAAVLVAARRAGVDAVFKVGGAQAIAAMAYGTESVPKCDKLFGPGNAWVTAAKLLVAADPAGAAADLPAGVTEVLIVADASARADFVAADLLAQAEHGVDAQALLVTDAPALATAVAGEVERRRGALSRGAILAGSIPHMRAIVVESIGAAIEVANAYAPEHLLLQVREPRAWLDSVRNAGAVFLGHWSPESVGDYCAGPNHTLPTYGYARSHSGLGLEDFQKRITVQELGPAGLRRLAGPTRTLAALEGLDAHAAAVTVRLEALEAARG